MWLPKQIVDIVTRQAENSELAVIKAERDIFKTQLEVTQSNFRWLSTRVNQLEYERAGLMEKAYGIKVPIPEIVGSPFPQSPNVLTAAIFEDLGELKSKELGLPSYS